MDPRRRVSSRFVKIGDVSWLHLSAANPFGCARRREDLQTDLEMPYETPWCLLQKQFSTGSHLSNEIFSLKTRRWSVSDVPFTSWAISGLGNNTRVIIPSISPPSNLLWLLSGWRTSLHSLWGITTNSSRNWTFPGTAKFWLRVATQTFQLSASVFFFVLSKQYNTRWHALKEK